MSLLARSAEDLTLKAGRGFLVQYPLRLADCTQRRDLNRDHDLNKCYSGRPTISVYAAFLADWLAHFLGDQLLVLPLEGLDESPREWLGGIFAFLGLRRPTIAEWNRLILPPDDKIKKKVTCADA